jgi:hypothetical protein
VSTIPVRTIDEGIEMLTGVKDGKQREDGTFEPDSINDKVQKRLTALAEKLRDFARTAEEKKRPLDNETEKPPEKKGRGRR